MLSRHRVLCCDYDETLAHDGVTADIVVAALSRAKNAGVRLVMVTGREIEELEEIFPQCRLFERIVAENGGLLVTPATGHKRLLALPPPGEFIDLLARYGVVPLSAGHVIVATRQPHEAKVRELIGQLNLKLHVIANKGALMVLPNGVNKGSGLVAALDEMSLSPEEAVGIGDAENDLAFLELCGTSVAVANALPSVKQLANIVTTGAGGAGVIEVIEGLLSGEAVFTAIERALPK